MADSGLDGAAAAQVRDQFRRQAAPRAVYKDAGSVRTIATISTVDDGQIGALVGQDRNPQRDDPVDRRELG